MTRTAAQHKSLKYPAELISLLFYRDSIEDNGLILRGNTIQPQKCVKELGVTVNDNLKCKEHITSLSKNNEQKNEKIINKEKRANDKAVPVIKKKADWSTAVEYGHSQHKQK